MVLPELTLDSTFRTMGLLVDLVCCGAVLLVMNWLVFLNVFGQMV